MILSANQEHYSAWDNCINPALFIFRRTGRSACRVNDNRGYDRGLLQFLIDAKAELIESTSTLNEENKQDEDSDFLWSARAENGKYVYLYKEHVISLSENCKGSISIQDDFASNQTSVIGDFAKFRVEEKSAKVSILLQGGSGLKVQSIDFDAPVIDDLELNYGEGFNKTHETIVSKLKSNKAGLMILHGESGTGKTNLIKHLTSIIDREVIFIPVGMVSELASPSFLTLMLNHKNAVLVLEDAEQALEAREANIHNSSTVATLLNLTDGLLGSIFSLVIIASFNADKSLIDKALLRKGRLLFDYTFNKLSVDCARRLAKHLKKDMIIDQPTSLAEVYNAEVDTGYKEPVKRSMGFGSTQG